MIADFSLFFHKHVHLILSKAFSSCVIPCLHKQQRYVTSIWEKHCLLRTQTQRVATRCLPCVRQEGEKPSRCARVCHKHHHISILQRLRENKD